MQAPRIGRRRAIVLGAMAASLGLAGCVGDDDTEDENGGFDTQGDFELPTEPADEEFLDRTGHEEVEIETIERADHEPQFLFDPPFVRIDRGTTVRWVNADGVFHTVTSTETLGNRAASDTFDASISSEGDTFEWTAEESGRQNYYCSPHVGFMFGALEIE